jgi:hypothetical protein
MYSAGRRTYSSGELLAIRRQQVERATTRPPSTNLQDSSELTARVRKFNSVLPEALPSYGNSANMVKYNDCSVVQAMRAGQKYRTAATNYQPRQDQNTCAQVPNRFLTSNPAKFGPTTPNVVECSYPIPDDQRVVQPFNLPQHFGMGHNTNKVVMSNNPMPVSGCLSCDQIEK